MYSFGTQKHAGQPQCMSWSSSYVTGCDCMIYYLQVVTLTKAGLLGALLERSFFACWVAAE